jgi:long-chain fatty acid transport protein
MRRTIPCLFLAVLVPGLAFAGGFEYPDNGTIAVGRGGAFAARADDPTAIAYNPAGLAGVKGTRLLFDSNLARMNMSFTRAGKDDEGNPFNTVSNDAGFFFAPMGVVTSDFGLKDFTFAIGAFGPSAIGKLRYPDDGPQRYQLISLDALIIYYTAAVAWRPHPMVDVGVAFQWADNVSTKFSQRVNAWFAEGASKGTLYDTKVSQNFKDRFAPAMLIGLRVRPMRGLQVGLSVRPFPVKFHQTGTVSDSYPGAYLGKLYEKGRVYITDKDVAMDLTLPIMGRLGVQYTYEKGDREIFDVEADLTYEAWRCVDSFDLDFDGSMVIKSDNGPDDVHQLNRISIPKRFKDTVSVRLGGDFNVVPDYLRVRAGGFYESPAVPTATTNLDFPSFTRFGVGGGFTASYYGFDLSFAYSHVFQLTRTVAQGESDIYQQMPMSLCQPPYTAASCNPQGVPPGPEVGAGKYVSGYDVLSVGLTVAFDKVFGKH